jgi:hypothetical protein
MALELIIYHSAESYTEIAINNVLEMEMNGTHLIWIIKLILSPDSLGFLMWHVLPAVNDNTKSILCTCINLFFNTVM